MTTMKPILNNTSNSISETGDALRSLLNWSQYRMLIQIPDSDKREYHNIRYICRLKNSLKEK